MTRPSSRLIANVVMVSAGVAAAYVIITTPPLRRLAGALARRWLGVTVPVFLITQARQASVESRTTNLT